MRETEIHAKSKQSVQSYKCSSGIFTQQGSTVVYKEKQINLYNMESVHTKILTALYRVTSEQLCDMWCELIQRAGESMDFLESFGESQLVLLPKIENIPCSDQFQPINITNSDYQIVMKYWTKWLMESAREVGLVLVVQL